MQQQYKGFTHMIHEDGSLADKINEWLLWNPGATVEETKFSVVPYNGTFMLSALLRYVGVTKIEVNE